ncbi:MAG: hypothetical protein QOG75_4481 [Mycobacterium sp.]|nr:hypothetical protein [Mycobacterium sp.]
MTRFSLRAAMIGGASSIVRDETAARAVPVSA